MKLGIRKPNIKKSIKARTTGKVKRMAKKAINPLYGKKGMGYINNPKKLYTIKYIIKHLLMPLIFLRNQIMHFLRYLLLYLRSVC